MSHIDFSTILAISIHDTKNALGMVLNSLDGLLDPATGECRCDGSHVARLQYEARRVNDNLVQLLMLYRADKGLYEPRIGPCLVYEMLEDYYLANKPMMDHHGISCDIDCAADLAWPLDQAMVAAVLENVITNTVRYTRDCIRIAAENTGGWLFLDVEDNGPGFPNTMLGRRTVAEDVPLDPKAGRTGLGLYFCTLIARMHDSGDRHGYIELSNDGSLGGGRFRLALPG
ncbi:MAG: HAMP domain-containing sensor histidine kinase [Thiohalomonadaceae bacterium]